MLYAITNRRLYGTNEARARAQLLEQAVVWAANSVPYIQLREKDMSTCDQVELARAIMEIIRTARKSSGLATRLLINARADVALAAGADGVHLPAGPDALTPEEVRIIFSAAGRTKPSVSISCHTLQQVESARDQQPDCILFAPVFEKVITEDQNPTDPKTLPGVGLASLEVACKVAAPVPVFALGGVTPENAPQCIQAGASGIAAIRLMRQTPVVWRHLT